MDLEAKISSLKNYVKLGTQDDRETKQKNDYQASSQSTAEANGWWGSMSNTAQEPDPWLPGLVRGNIHAYCVGGFSREEVLHGNFQAVA